MTQPTTTWRDHGNGLWTASQDLILGGVNLGCRMSVIRLANGSLLCVSPVRPTDDLLNQLNAIGSVEFIIGPNPVHHLFLPAFASKFPRAKILGVKALFKKHPTLPLNEATSTIVGNLDPSLEGVVVHLGHFEEVVLFHKPSQSLIVVDLVFHLKRVKGTWPRFALKLYGILDRFGPSFAIRWLARNRTEANRQLAPIKQWPFDRVIMAHGDVVETSGRELFIGAFTHWRAVPSPS